MQPTSLPFSALVAALLALLGGLITPAGASPVAATLAAFAALAALNPVAPVHSAPVAGRFVAVVDGLPSCAKPAMDQMLSRASTFDCGPREDGSPDVACLCRNKPFRTEAKRAVGEACQGPADQGSARNWAIGRCMDVHLQANLAALPPGTSLVGNNTSSSSVLVSPSVPSLPKNASFDTPANAAVTSPKTSTASIDTGSTAALQEAIFDIDDDEDWTADAKTVRPAVTLMVVVALGVVGVLF